MNEKIKMGFYFGLGLIAATLVVNLVTGTVRNARA